MSARNYSVMLGGYNMGGAGYFAFCQLPAAVRLSAEPRCYWLASLANAHTHLRAICVPYFYADI